MEQKFSSLRDVDDILPRSSLISRNITVLSKRTSVRLEPEMWASLKEIARLENCSVHEICSLIHLRKGRATSLTAAIRVFLMLYFKAAATDEGHRRAGHGSFENMKSRARMNTVVLSSSGRIRRNGGKPARVNGSVQAGETGML